MLKLNQRKNDSFVVKKCFFHQVFIEESSSSLIENQQNGCSCTWCYGSVRRVLSNNFLEQRQAQWEKNLLKIQKFKSLMMKIEKDFLFDAQIFKFLSLNEK
jgi:hypothetical protein